MRISLLRQREPFGQILERTLAQYLESTTGVVHTLHWHEKQQSRAGAENSIFLANEILNVIFHPSLPQTAFDPTRREFSRSTVAWRRPLQRTYVTCATRNPLAAWMAHARLEVTPRCHELERQLVIPGNQKLRVLDHEARTCTSLLKDGFRDDSMRAELASREIAEQLQILIPKTLDCDVENGILREAYVSATPLNRLPNASLARNSREVAFGYIQRLTEATSRQTPLTAYLDGLAEEIHSRINRYETDNPQTVELSRQLVRDLLNQIRELATKHNIDDSLRVAVTHGDFQPANIVVNDEGTWLIDWENSKERQAGYDWLTMNTEARSALDRPKRLQEAITDDNLRAPAWTGLAWNSHKEKNYHLAIFQLEELATKLNEVSHPAIPHLADDYVQLADEVREWQQQTAH